LKYSFHTSSVTFPLVATWLPSSLLPTGAALNTTFCYIEFSTKEMTRLLRSIPLEPILVTNGTAPGWTKA